VPRDASVGSSRQQGRSAPSSESSERVDEVRVGAVTDGNGHKVWRIDMDLENNTFCNACKEAIRQTCQQSSGLQALDQSTIKLTVPSIKLLA
jgi:hypothetical protein